MGKKTSVELSPVASAVIRKDPRRQTHVMNAALPRYMEFVKQFCPELSDEEWAFLSRTRINGMVEEIWSIDHIESSLIHYIEENQDLVERYGDLIRRIAAMSWAQKCSVVDRVERFWAERRNKQKSCLARRKKEK